MPNRPGKVGEGLKVILDAILYYIMAGVILWMLDEWKKGH